MTSTYERLDGPIHGWFGLTYANWLVLPRTLVQSMPVEWQEQFVALLDGMREHFGSETIDNVTPVGGYRVTCVDANGKFTKNPCPHYNRGRTFIPGKHEGDA